MALPGPQMFTITPKFTAALELINTIPGNKFPLLLTRIIEQLHVPDAATFSPEEEERLQSMLKLSAGQLHSVLTACAFMFEQAAYQSADGASLNAHLVDAGMEQEQATATVGVWNEHAKALLAHLRNKTLGGPQVLAGSSYRLDLQMGMDGLTKLTEPTTVFEMALTSADAPAGAGAAADAGAEKFAVEFSHDELYAFFLKLERVQEQLDTLS
jgi:COMM domain containing 10